jgi:CBS domain-containing protein
MAELVRGIMETTPVTVSPDTSVEDVVGTLREHELPGVPVVDGDGRCVGIVTEADLVIGDEEGDIHIPHYIELFGGVVFLEPLRNFERKFKKAVASRVNDLMTEDPVTVDVTATAREAAKVIVDRHHNHLPVVEHGRLVGLVTRADVLGALVED